MHETGIEVKLQKLPVVFRREVLDYLEFLTSKYQSKKVTHRKFKFNWEGGLADIKERFTSVELQHKVLEWR
ncbi:MAG: DUF2281 domain-containing protein [Elusimicrobiota bacterium]